MRTRESAQLDRLVSLNKVEWRFTDRQGKGWLAGGKYPAVASCTVVLTGAVLIELRHKPGEGYEPVGSDILTGKELRELPMPEFPHEVELPLYHLTNLERAA